MCKVNQNVIFFVAPFLKNVIELMKKERIHIFSNTTDILLDRLSAQTKPKDKATETSDNAEAKSDDSQ